MRYLPAILVISACGCAALQPQGGGSGIPMGRLGQPLGTYLTIEGVRMEEGKVGTRTLLVDTVHGKKLSSPIGVWVENAKDPGLPKGEKCIIRGYESGEMIGLPEAVAEAENMPPPQAMWQFRRYFIITSVVGPKSLEKD